MTARTRLILSTIAGTLASAAYWWGFFLVAYSLTAGDYRPGSPQPGDVERMATSGAVLIGGMVVYGIGAWLWRALDFRLAGRDG